MGALSTCLTQEDRALARELRAGRVEAFEALVTRFQDPLYDFCLRMLGDREEALDLLQDVFLSVHQHATGFREQSSLKTWLFRLTKNQCLNKLKYLRRRRAPGAQRADDPASPPADELLARAADRLRVQRALALLPPEARMMVVLRDIEGLSYEEIQEITDLPIGTIKSRLHRARERLAGVLEHDEA